ncbi:hypothetical protein [Streptomyces sp. N35]|uniref:hypothetical protein n=1 Tax=Streptomyces sp. N35 TaxID=2795730 RepID=UPI0018F540A2|nr:hypothetical protein [Streptomyces sp. N35]
MNSALRPWRAEDFDEECATCQAPAGEWCRPGCDTGYTAEDARREAEQSRAARPRLTRDAPPDIPKE